jgi:hypothetical protein
MFKKDHYRNGWTNFTKASSMPDDDDPTARSAFGWTPKAKG